MSEDTKTILLIPIAPENENDIETMEKVAGQLIIEKISKKVYLDREDLIREDITDSCICVDSLSDLTNVENSPINKLYIVLDDVSVYKNLISCFSPVQYLNDAEDVVNGIIEMKPTLIVDENTARALSTTADQVLDPSGKSVNEVLGESNLLTVYRTKAVYVQVTEDKQKIFTIPYPKSDYDFTHGDTLSVIVKDTIIDSTLYHVNNELLIFDDPSIPTVNTGDYFIIVFYYRVVYDLNNGVVLGTNNIEDKSITSSKISDDFALSADRVFETNLRLFFSPLEKAKLAGIENNATCYHHPDTHPATMIDEDNDHLFITTDQLNLFMNKADADKVYTKTETEDLIKQVIGGAPEILDTLIEIDKSLNNDPDFAGTMTKELAKKATIEQLQKVQDDVDSRVSIHDYVHSPAYGTLSVLEMPNDKISKYTLRVEDSTLQEYQDGMCLVCKVRNVNLGSSSLRIDTGDKELDYCPILTQDGYELIPGDLNAGSIYQLRFDGINKNFILQGKGGIKIQDTYQKKYPVGDDYIERGYLLDIIDETAYISMPRVRILSRNKTSEPKFYSDGKIEVFSVNDKQFLAFWKYESQLRAQLFNIVGDNISITSSTPQYITVNGSCTDYFVEKINDRSYLLVTADNTKMFTAVNIYLDADEILIGTKYTRQESQDITNVFAVHLDKNKCIYGWQANENTRTMYVSVEQGIISIISNRDNVDYPLNKVCKVSNTQILFAKVMNDNTIRKWVMTVMSDDFVNSSLSYIEGENSNDKFSNLSITRVDDTKAICTAISQDMETLNTWDVTINANGDSVVSDHSTQSFTADQMKTYMIPKFHRIEDTKYYLSASQYDYTKPSLTEDPAGAKCIKIAVSKFDKGVMLTDIVSDIPEMSNNIDIDFIGDKRFIFACNYVPSLDAKAQLYFVYGFIGRVPDAVALNSGNKGNTITAFKW